MAEDNVYTALHAVYQQVGYVQKTGRNDAQRYRYAGEADLIAAIRPAMVKAGLVFFCSDVRDLETREIRKSKNGIENVTINVAGNFVFTFAHAKSGTTIQVMARGEGSDSLDKASAKAMTGALKYALRQTFVIETGDDPDKDASDDEEPAAPPARAASDAMRQPVNIVDADGVIVGSTHSWREALAFYGRAKKGSKDAASVGRANLSTLRAVLPYATNGFKDALAKEIAAIEAIGNTTTKEPA